MFCRVAYSERGEFLHKLSIEYVKDELRILFFKSKKVKKPLKGGRREKNVFLRSFFSSSNLDQDVLFPSRLLFTP